MRVRVRKYEFQIESGERCVGISRLSRKHTPAPKGQDDGPSALERRSRYNVSWHVVAVPKSKKSTGGTKDELEYIGQTKTFGR